MITRVVYGCQQRLVYRWAKITGSRRFRLWAAPLHHSGPGEALDSITFRATHISAPRAAESALRYAASSVSSSADRQYPGHVGSFMARPFPCGVLCPGASPGGASPGAAPFGRGVGLAPGIPASQAGLTDQSAAALTTTACGTPRVFQLVADWSLAPKVRAIDVKSRRPLAIPTSSRRFAVSCMVRIIKFLNAILLYSEFWRNLNSMCNDATSIIIKDLGGPSALARELGYSVARVFNWTTRGIPPLEMLKHAAVFQRSPAFPCLIQSLGYGIRLPPPAPSVEESAGNNECASVR